MSREAEARNLLLKIQIGAQLEGSIISILDLIIEQVRIIWKTSLREVASMLCLDISRAFDNVLHQRLLYNIRMQGYFNHILRFLSSFLQDRTT